MFFVLSSGRSGSKTIASALTQFKNCVCLHHPQPELVVEASEYFCGDYPEDRIRTVLHSTRAPIVNGKVYGEANLQLSLLVPLLNELFPDCQFVWLIRDGRDSVASMFCRGWYDPTVDPLKHPVWHKARLQGDRTGDFTRAEWADLPPFGRCCWIWKKYNATIELVLKQIPRDRWCRVYLDQLKSSLPELSRFLGIQGESARVEKLNVAVQQVSYWDSWTSEQKYLFEQLCGQSMDCWYPEWRSTDGRWHNVNYEIPDRASLLATAQRYLCRLGRLPRRICRVIYGRGETTQQCGSQ